MSLPTFISEFHLAFTSYNTSQPKIEIPYGDHTIPAFLRFLTCNNINILDLYVSQKLATDQAINMELLDVDYLLQKASLLHVNTCSVVDVSSAPYEINKIQISSFFQKNYLYISDQTHNCFKKYGRNIRKAQNTLRKQRVFSADEFKRILTLGNRKTTGRDPEISIQLQVKFCVKYSHSDKVVGYALYDQATIVAGIIGIVVGNRMLMILNNYDEAYLWARPNDYLYFLLYCHANNHHLECIDWGETAIDDVGLIRYKNKYSNAKKICKSVRYIVHIR